MAEDKDTAKPEYSWPPQGSTSLLDNDVTRVDGLPKASGTAKYSYDQNPKGLLYARLLGSPHASAKIKAIDTLPAEKVPGVRLVMSGEDFIGDAVKDQFNAKDGVMVLKKVGSEIMWQGEPIAVVVAETEAAAAEGCDAIRVDYELFEPYVDDDNIATAIAMGRSGKGGLNIKLEAEPGDDDDEDEFYDKEINRLLDECAVKVEGLYGINAITHMCLEPHGSTCEWNGDKLTAHLSTQNVSGTPGQFAGPLGVTADDVTVICDYIGGGFGSKFAADEWGVVAAAVSKLTGQPVKLMLTREMELKTAGCRPSAFMNVRLGADKDGLVTVWDSHHWGTGGPKGGGVNLQVIPYVFTPKSQRVRQTTIATNTSPTRAWRAPNHPQACAICQTAYDDVAAKLGLDSYDVFERNLSTVTLKKGDVSMIDTYREEMKIAAQLIDWKAKWHPHGKGESKGSIVTGLGMALHTWGGGGHNSTCRIKIHPDGGIETTLASQDLGTGTRTAINIVVSQTFGLPIDAVKVNIGNSKYPPSGPSGGSTTIGGVSESNRRAAQDALRKLNELVGKKLGVDPTTLEAKNGRIQVIGDTDKSLAWKDACSLLGMAPLEVEGVYTRGVASPLSSSQVGGVQMAEVAVDRDTGVVKMKKFVAVQDIGLVVNRLTAKSQIYGAAIMGIAAALFEERIMDINNGAFLNADIADYKLPRLGDIGDIVVELYEPESEYKRGVIGLGEPPAISPAAAISNAVCNALGVRVPILPMTPQRVLEALEKGSKA